MLLLALLRLFGLFGVRFLALFLLLADQILLELQRKLFMVGWVYVGDVHSTHGEHGQHLPAHGLETRTVAALGL